jgi:hypothetical protein
MLTISILDLLVVDGYLPSIAMCKRSNRIVFFCAEASKYLIFLRSLQGNISRMSKGEPIPLQEIPSLERTYDRQFKTNDSLHQAAYWTHVKQQIREKMQETDDDARYVRFGDRLTFLSWVYVLAVPISSVVSWMSKIRTVWHFQFLDLMLCAVFVRLHFAVSPLVELDGMPSLRQCEAQSWMENYDLEPQRKATSPEIRDDSTERKTK